MSPLSYSDREAIKKTLLQFQKTCGVDDGELIRQMSRLLNELPKTAGYEKAFYHDALDLLNYLRTSPQEDDAAIARGAFLYILDARSTSNDRPLLVSTQILAFIASFARHQINELTGQGPLLRVGGLLAEERHAAEEMFLTYLDKPYASDEELFKHAEQVSRRLTDASNSALFGRFKENVHLLGEILMDEDRSAEDRAWARAALSYLMQSDDVINDSLGLVGHLDDVFVAQTAIDLIGPVESPWLELVAEILSRWPFLKEVLFEYAGEAYQLSELSLINIALACPAMRGDGDNQHTALILPTVGITPFVVSFTAALAMVASHLEESSRSLDFKIGQKVIVDGQAVALFDGTDNIAGQAYIRLKQYSTKKGVRLEGISRIPLNESARLCPAAPDAAVRGSIRMHLENTSLVLSAVERIFHLSIPVQFHSIPGRVWLVSNTSAMRVLAHDISVQGQRIVDVLPIGHAKRNGETEIWSTRFGVCEPVLLIVSDLDLAVELIDERGATENDIVVVDMGGANKGRYASLSYLESTNARVYCVAHEKDTEVSEILEEEDFKIWEWGREDVKHLVWPDTVLKGHSGHPIVANDARIFASYSTEWMVEAVSLEQAANAYKCVQDLAGRMRKRQSEDIPADLDVALEITMRAFFSAIRLPCGGNLAERIVSTILAELDRLSKGAAVSIYLTEEERLVVRSCCDRILELVAELSRTNKKEQLIERLMREHRGGRILVAPEMVDVDTLSEVDQVSDWRRITLANVKGEDEAPLIVTYWPGRERAWRVLAPPLGNPIHFVLYDFEAEWLEAFNRNRVEARKRRRKHNKRASIFPSVEDWPKRIQREEVRPGVREPIDTAHDLSQIRDARRRSRLIRSITAHEPADVTATLVMFEGDAHVFLSNEYSAKVATHLMSGDVALDDDSATVLTKNVKELVLGDVLVFLRGTDSDAIRILADANLPPGVRETAKLWQKALRRYVDRTAAGVELLRDKLNHVGCKRHPATIRNWLEDEEMIAPREAHRGALEAICNVTQDEELIEKKDACSAAITIVWGEHQRVANAIAKRVLESIGEKLGGVPLLDEPLELGDALVLVRVEFIDSDTVLVPRSAINKLIEER